MIQYATPLARIAAYLVDMVVACAGVVLVQVLLYPLYLLPMRSRRRSVVWLGPAMVFLLAALIFAPAFFTARRQALHDMAAGTVVTR